MHNHRNLLAHAPERLREEITADYNDMIYAATREEIQARRSRGLSETPTSVLIGLPLYSSSIRAS